MGRSLFWDVIRLRRIMRKAGISPACGRSCVHGLGGRGSFSNGAHQGDPDALPREQPRHLVRVDGFHMDRHEVTNAQFAEFVESTGYVTVAERPIDTPQGSYDPGSMTFFSPEAIFSLRTLDSGGGGQSRPVGNALKAQVQRVKRCWVILSCTSRLRMPWLMRHGGGALAHRSRVGVCSHRSWGTSQVSLGQRSSRAG